MLGMAHTSYSMAVLIYMCTDTCGLTVSGSEGFYTFNYLRGGPAIGQPAGGSSLLLAHGSRMLNSDPWALSKCLSSTDHLTGSLKVLYARVCT